MFTMTVRGERAKVNFQDMVGKGGKTKKSFFCMPEWDGNEIEASTQTNAI